MLSPSLSDLEIICDINEAHQITSLVFFFWDITCYISVVPKAISQFIGEGEDDEEEKGGRGGDDFSDYVELDCTLKVIGGAVKILMSWDHPRWIM